MQLQLNDRIALVTAYSGGIGLDIARSLVREGATVIINGRTSEGVKQACEDIYAQESEAKLQPLVANNSTVEGCQKTITEFPDVDIIVNNLGIYEVVDFFSTTDEQWQHIFEVNIMSGVRLNRHYLSKMLVSKKLPDNNIYC